MSRTIDIFQISNSNSRRKMYLAESREQAIQFAFLDGHIRARKNAWKIDEGIVSVSGNDHKFASAIRRAIEAEATGPVTNSSGIALVHSQVFMPLSAI